ncbi:hypothetical protein ACFFIF_02915 [Vagococcus entomophilus]|uniref:Shikimate kinase n=1 Tax=Vagococcus entomophilus TaxID=1160095 RepID=A0A430AK09_9ENTE|nr:hypothetical protein [Vagococcus entomophilus]RSU08257.1 hypothetical protein CBF30_03175 [Vagococcus entomophilus]
MGLFVIIGPQAVGKMTVGKELEQHMDGKLLFNHQTIDLFANFLTYDKRTFQLSDQTRKSLFKAFVAEPEHNAVNTLIFTILINFSAADDIQFLKEISEIFLNAGQPVYFLELAADLDTRLERNQCESRLQAKPSKRDLAFSKKELLDSHHQFRLNSLDGELANLFPTVHHLKVNNTELSSQEVVKEVLTTWPELKNEKNMKQK